MISEEQQGVIVCRVLKDLHSKEELFGGPAVTNFDTLLFEDFCKSRLKSIEEWYVVVIIVPYTLVKEGPLKNVGPPLTLDSISCQGLVFIWVCAHV